MYNQNPNCGCSESRTTYTHCNNCQPSEPCDCAVKDLSTDCILYTDDTIQCDATDVIIKNINLTDNLKNLVNYFCSRFSEIQGYFSVTNIGTGSSIYKGDSLIGEKQLRRINTGDDLIEVNQNTDDISISVNQTELINIINDNTPASCITSQDNSIEVTSTDNCFDLSITLDTTPTDSSTNAVQSNGVFDALAGKQPLLGFTPATIPQAKYESIVISASDLLTNITTGTSVAYLRMPFAMTVAEVRASLLTPQTAGSLITFDINNNGTSILSTKLTIDNNEKSSTTATTSYVISSGSLADDAEITIDIDIVGTPGAKGANITIIGERV